MTDIYFYGRDKGRVDGRYKFLANFFRAAMTVDGVEYATVEHYFQAMKHRGTDLEKEIRLAPSPRDAKKIAWSAPPPADWEERKEEVMLKALRAKFRENIDLAEKLLATGEARLHEDSPKDLYWGVRGKDRLGILLMQVREELRKDWEKHGG